MAANKKIIVGLGNPGDEYSATRHNIGFVVVDRVAERARVDFGATRRDAIVAAGSWRSRAFVLAKPQAYMNRSGNVVTSLLRLYGLHAGDMLVVYDDINLATGRVRARTSGSAGGHNGLQDIIDELGHNEFPRLRVGVGNDFPKGGQSDYVLSAFSEEDLVLISPAIDTAAEAALTFVKDGMEHVMNRFNRRSS